MVIILGIELPDTADCNRCGKKDACSFKKVGYDQPCGNCKDTPEYEEEMRRKNEESASYKRVYDSLKTNVPMGVFEGRGRELVVNHRGDVIANVPAKPRPLGKQDAGHIKNF